MVAQPDGMLSSLWAAVGTHLWQTSLMLLALFLLMRLVKKAPAVVANVLLLMGLAKLLVPLPLLKSILGNVTDWIASVVSSAPGISSAAPVIVRAFELPSSVTFLGSARSAGSTAAPLLPIVLTAVWAAGAVALLAASAARARTALRPSLMAPDDAPKDVAARLDKALETTRIPHCALALASEPIAPHVVGLIRPRIIVPEKLVREISPAELRCILLHEDAHRRRREPVRLLLARAAAVMFFFYPPVWPLVRRLRETGEMVCDDLALAAGAEPRAYARALAGALGLELTAAPGSAAFDRRSPTLLRRRLERLNERRRYKMRVSHRAVLLVAAVCLLLSSALALTSVAGDPTTGAAAPAPKAKPAPQAAPEVPEPAAEPEAAPLPEKFYIKGMVPPEYPEEARAAGVEAIVFIAISIDDEHKVVGAEPRTIIVGHPPLEIIKIGEDGQVVEPVEEEGMEVYHEAFINAAVEAVRGWSLGIEPDNAKFENPAAVVPIQFRLDGDSEKKAE